ncbi:MAG: carboxypeptidase-like regulatory domain-containing protein [Rhodothermales bacterium]
MFASGQKERKSVACFILSFILTVAAITLPVSDAFGQAADDARGQNAGEHEFAYDEAPLRDVLSDVRERAGFHFLYRDVLVAGKTVSFTSNAEEVLARLNDALTAHGLRLRVDAPRNQVLVGEVHESAANASGRHAPIRGVVVDDEHGTRLPYATVTWYEDRRLRGTATDASGHFRLHVSADTAVDLSISHIGYSTRHIRVDADAGAELIPVRLVPETAYGPEVIVSTAALQSEVDTTWHHLLQAGIFSPLGESGVMRSLQTLPSVSLSTAATSGLNVRGSRADGFQVLLDGMSIYNQSHLFGLFDAFNEDVLQTVGLYYGIAPASLQGPPGGTLSFVTRTGSMTGVHGSMGVSNTSGKGTLEGPFAGGRGSWLISGRRSYLNAFDGFDNDALIRLGLDVGRETDVPTGPVREVPVSALTTGDASAHFYDVHGKLAYEWAPGARLVASGYVGGDETLHRAERFANAPHSRDAPLINADTKNSWHNAAASLRLQTPIGSTAYAESVAGLSRYRSAFSKDDFVYTDPTRMLLPQTDTSHHVVRPFSNENELLELKLAQNIDVPASGTTWSAGYAFHHYAIDYHEQSILRDGFGGTQESAQADVFAQVEGRFASEIALAAGLRTHYFQRGRFFRLSPRLRVRLFPDRRLSFAAGFSRNHQFVHRLYVEQSTHADIWVMSTAEQPPGSVDHVSAGTYLQASPRLHFQVEAYRKHFTNLREHEASAARRRLRPISPLLDPWLHDNEGRARGIEMMARLDFGTVTWTNSYTLSAMELRNRRVSDGSWYPADWDRRHQLTSHMQLSIGETLQLHLIWASGSGTPNALAHAVPREPSRLPAYHRMDAGLRWHQAVGSGTFEVKASVFNVLDRANTWYRRPVPVATRSPAGRRVGLMNVDVYDLGRRPSLEISYSF